MSNERDAVLDCARRAREAARILRSLTREQKDAALRAGAQALVDQTAAIVEANALDVARAQAAGTSPAIIDRLTLTPDRVAAVAQAMRDTAELADPVGETVRDWTRTDGLRIQQVRVPLGVVAMIYEARPNVTVDAAALCLKSGNAALLRGSSSALSTNTSLVEVLRNALVSAEIPADAVQLVPGGHDAVDHLMHARGLVDLLIPRGGADLINRVVEGATVPVVETGVGNVHVYIDKDADLAKAEAIIINAKTQRVSVCNAAETMLVHADIAESFLPIALSSLNDKGVTIHGDAVVQKYAESVGATCIPATDQDWAAEYYSLDLAVAVVDDLQAALAHIRRWSTGHTEAIVSESPEATAQFIAGVDSAAVMVNASTRFTDGAEFGFGAEIGISTQKTHARGPMGLAELTTTTYIVTGQGHVRS